MKAMLRNADSSPADLLGENLCELAAHVHAAMAQLTRMAAAFDDQEAWGGYGIRSCAHWLAINAGFDVFTADELLRVGHALTTLPRIAAAFGGGELSFDKVRAVTRVATSADEELWVELARQASGSQLARICRGYRRATEANDADRAERHLARRGLWTHWEDDGMLRLQAVLPPEDGAVVLAALQAAVGAQAAQGGESGATALAEVSNGTALRDPALDTHAVRRADALVALCQSNGTARGKAGAPAPPQLVVHVDLGVLTGDASQGRCHLEDGPALSAAAARRIGCDAEVVAVSERDGLPINVGRARRVVPTKLRRALQSRDRTCCFPGCAVPARQTHAHHVEHWIDGGPTDLANLASLCGFHHRRLHDGVYRIRAEADATLHFETANGRSITVRQLRVAGDGPAPGGNDVAACVLDPWLTDPAAIAADTPKAGDGGRRCDFRYVVDSMVDGCEHARARAETNPRAAPDP
jgi:hypothetical protein